MGPENVALCSRKSQSNNAILKWTFNLNFYTVSSRYKYLQTIKNEVLILRVHYNRNVSYLNIIQYKKCLNLRYTTLSQPRLHSKKINLHITRIQLVLPIQRSVRSHRIIPNQLCLRTNFEFQFASQFVQKACNVPDNDRLKINLVKYLLI
jgi:hypothetical protein